MEDDSPDIANENIAIESDANNDTNNENNNENNNTNNDTNNDTNNNVEISPKTYKNLVVRRSANYKIIEEGLDIVKQFIIDHDVILVGGLAIDLALKLKNNGVGIYADDEIPDYDFITPNFDTYAYMLAKILCDKDFPGSQVIGATHITTLRVRVDFIPIADITYVHPKVYSEISYIKIGGMKVIDPQWQKLDLHRSLALPFENPPQYPILHRWKKDITRFKLMNEAYPLEFSGKSAGSGSVNGSKGGSGNGSKGENRNGSKCGSKNGSKGGSGSNFIGRGSKSGKGEINDIDIKYGWTSIMDKSIGASCGVIGGIHAYCYMYTQLRNDLKNLKSLSYINLSKEIQESIMTRFAQLPKANFTTRSSNLIFQFQNTAPLELFIDTDAPLETLKLLKAKNVEDYNAYRDTFPEHHKTVIEKQTIYVYNNLGRWLSFYNDKENDMKFASCNYVLMQMLLKALQNKNIQAYYTVYNAILSIMDIGQSLFDNISSDTKDVNKDANLGDKRINFFKSRPYFLTTNVYGKENISETQKYSREKTIRKIENIKVSKHDAERPNDLHLQSYNCDKKPVDFDHDSLYLMGNGALKAKPLVPGS